MSTQASPAVVSMPKPRERSERRILTAEERMLLSHTLSNLCALGLVKRVIDGIGVVRYQLTNRRMA
jgi:hypothetical protein